MTPSWVLQQPGGAYPTGYTVQITHTQRRPARVRGAMGCGNPLSRHPGLTRATVGGCIEVSRHVRHSLPVHRFYSFSFSIVYRVWVSKDIFPQLYSIVYRYSALFSYSISVRFWYRVLRDSIYSDFSCSTLPHTDSIDFISAHWDLGLTPSWGYWYFSVQDFAAGVDPWARGVVSSHIRYSSRVESELSCMSCIWGLYLIHPCCILYMYQDRVEYPCR